jgi:hypothetical protein
MTDETRWEQLTARARIRIHDQAVRGLFLLNGGGAIALLGFLQAVWDKDRNLARFSVLGLLFLSIGLMLAGACGYFRHQASLTWQYRRGTRSQRFWHYASYSVQFSSLGAFSVGVLFVVFGALSLL